MQEVHFVTDSTGKILYVQLSIETYNALVEDSEMITQNRLSAAVSTKAYSMDEIRKKHSAAYNLWTEEEERELKINFFEGMSVKDIAKALGRKEGAITSRLKRLGITYTK